MGTSKRKSVFNDILKLLAFRLNLPGYIVINLGNNVFGRLGDVTCPTRSSSKTTFRHQCKEFSICLWARILPLTCSSPLGKLFVQRAFQNVSEQAHDAIQLNKTKMHHAKSLKASRQTTKVVQPGKETLYLPAIMDRSCEKLEAAPVSSLPSSFPGYCAKCPT